MSPVGHASISFVASKLNVKFSVKWLIAGGVIPDIDWLFFVFPWFNALHRVITHNLPFAILAGLFVYLISSKQDRLINSASVVLGVILHLLIDSMFDSNPTNGIGVAVFWPLSDYFFSPVNLSICRENTVGWSKPIPMIVSNLPDLFYELPFILTSLWFIFKSVRK